MITDHNNERMTKIAIELTELSRKRIWHSFLGLTVCMPPGVSIFCQFNDPNRYNIYRHIATSRSAVHSSCHGLPADQCFF